MRQFKSDEINKATGIKFVKRLFSSSWPAQNNDVIKKNAEYHACNSEKIGSSLGLIRESRPSSLPAKNKKEEIFHEKLHNEIIKNVRRREDYEKKKTKEKREDKLKNEDKLIADLMVWTNKIIPNFGLLKNSEELSEMWWRGIPPSIRGKVWQMSIVNYLNITSDIFESCLGAIKEPNDDFLTCIQLDVSRTFPNLCVYKKNGPLYESLINILGSYCIYKPDISYVQGMSFIGGILMLNMEPKNAFICFCNLLNNPCHKAAYTLDENKLNSYFNLYNQLLLKNIPQIHKYFLKVGLTSDFYLIDWIYTIFSKALPLDITCRIWDIFIRDGDEFLFRAAIGILKFYQEELMQMDFINGAKFLIKLPENLDVGDLLNCISTIHTSIGNFTFSEMVDNFNNLSLGNH